MKTFSMKPSLGLNLIFILTLFVREIISFTPLLQHVHVGCGKNTNAVFYSPIRSFGLKVMQATSNQDNGDDFESIGNTAGDNYEGDIDWDAEWKKVVQNREQPTSRPGNYKNDVERALLKTTKATGEQIKKVKIVTPDINVRSLQSDPKV